MIKTRSKKIVITLLTLVIIVLIFIFVLCQRNKENVKEEYEEIEVEYSIIEQDGKYGVEDSNGNTIIPCLYNWIDNCSDGMFLVKNNEEKYGFINTQGNMLVRCEYTEGYAFNNGIGVLVNEGGATYFDATGKIIGTANCALPGSTGTYDENDYLAILNPSTELYGFIDMEGNLKIKYKWTYATNFCNNLALVANDTGEYVIDMNENVILNNKILEKYAYIETVFENEMIIVYEDENSCGVINMSGKEIIPCSTENNYIQITDEFIIVNTNESTNYYNYEGELYYTT